MMLSNHVPTDVTVFPWKPSGSIDAIASKSVAHRALIASALSECSTTLLCHTTSEDIEATASCLHALGAHVTRSDSGFDIDPIRSCQQSDEPVSIDCRESGSTLRFLLPVVCALGRSATFLGSGRLPSRPLSPMSDRIVEHGCTLSTPGEWPLRVSGALRGGEFRFPGNVSSQFATGILLALPLVGGGSVTLEGRVESRPYIDITIDVLRLFGVCVAVNESDVDGVRLTTFSVDGSSAYTSPRVARVEGDWSNAAFWLCAAAVSNAQVRVRGLNASSAQGDAAVVDALRRFGAHVDVAEDQVICSSLHRTLQGTTLDVADIPDLVPALAVVAAAAHGETRFINASRLRIKESDRLATTAQLVRFLGAQAIESEDELIVRGVSGARFCSGTTFGHNDHRLTMAAAVSAVNTDGPVRIIGAQAAAKSYPGFFDDLCSLGGTCSYTNPATNTEVC